MKTAGVEHTVFTVGFLSDREAIVAAVLAHGASNILPSEMEIKNPKMLRYAPG
jgi:hypothetical protein